MRNILAFFAALMLTFLGVGYFMNWYSISTTPGPDGRRSVTIDLNTRKIGQDIHESTEKLQALIENANKDKAATAADGKDGKSSRVEPANSWWTPTSATANQWDARPAGTPTAPNPWQPRRPYDDVPLVIPPARDR